MKKVTILIRRVLGVIIIVDVFASVLASTTQEIWEFTIMGALATVCIYYIAMSIWFMLLLWRKR